MVEFPPTVMLLMLIHLTGARIEESEEEDIFPDSISHHEDLEDQGEEHDDGESEEGLDEEE